MRKNLDDALSSLRATLAELRSSSLRVLQLFSEFEKQEVKGANPETLGRILSKIEKLLPSLREWRSISMLEGWLDDKRKELEELKKDFYAKMALQLEELLKEKGFELRGSYPKLRAKFYTINVDFQKGGVTIWYGPEQELMAKCKLDPQAVALKLMQVHDKLTKRPLDAKTFLEKLYQSYVRVISLGGGQAISKAPIIRVLNELCFLIQDKRFYNNPTREYFRGYGRSFFSYDLYRLKERTVRGKHLELEVATITQSTSRSNYLWVPTNERGDGSIYSSIVFREVR